MEFFAKIPDKSIKEVMSTIGYTLHSHYWDDFSMVRRVGENEYPRFHLHVIMINGGSVGHKFVLHIDKRKMLGDSCALFGRRHGEELKEEIKRIKRLIDQLEHTQQQTGF